MEITNKKIPHNYRNKYLKNTSSGGFISTSNTPSGASGLPYTYDEDGNYVVDKTITFKGNVLSTGEVCAYAENNPKYEGTYAPFSHTHTIAQVDNLQNILDSFSGGTGTTITVVDSLTSTSIDSALSANQGRTLKELIDNKSSVSSWDELLNKPSTFPPSEHTHDDRYYTESEVENKLLNKSDNEHTHDRLRQVYGSSIKGGYDMNTLFGNGGGITSQYGGNEYWKNAPIGMKYGSVITLAGYGYDATWGPTLRGQFAWDVNHNTNNGTNNLWFRTSNNIGWNDSWDKLITNRNWTSHIDGRYLPLTGGTVSGNVDINGVASIKDGIYLRGNSANSEAHIRLVNGVSGRQWGIKAGSYGSNENDFTITDDSSTHDPSFTIQANTKAVILGGELHLPGWIYSTGNVGWYNGTYSSGIYSDTANCVSTYEANNFRCKGIINAYRYNSNNSTAAITMDKQGTYAMGIGADGTLMRMKFGAVADMLTGVWQNDAPLEYYFSGSILATGEITAYSDIRLKSNIKKLTNRGKLNPITYTKNGKESIGFIAQEVKEIYPELVIEEQTENKYLSLNYAQLTSVLAAQINELTDKVNELTKQIKELKNNQ